MAIEHSPNSPEFDLLDRLIGDASQLTDEEIDALYEAASPQDDPRERVHRLAEQAAVTYRTRQQLPPEHVQAALNATKTQNTLGGATRAALKGMLEALKPPVRGPVGDPSFAFHKRTELTDDDRRILDEQAEELSDDWEDTDEE